MLVKLAAWLQRRLDQRLDHEACVRQQHAAGDTQLVTLAYAPSSQFVWHGHCIYPYGFALSASGTHPFYYWV